MAKSNPRVVSKKSASALMGRVGKAHKTRTVPKKFNESTYSRVLKKVFGI